MRAIDVELAVVSLLDYRRYIMVPNVSWGFGLRHEADLLAMDPQGRITEIEIKVSKSDLLADFKKPHQHESPYISRLVYAMPESMIGMDAVIPKQYGIIIVTNKFPKPEAKWHRFCRHDISKKPVSADKAMELARLGCMRIWSLKHKLKNG